MLNVAKMKTKLRIGPKARSDTTKEEPQQRVKPVNLLRIRDVHGETNLQILERHKRFMKWMKWFKAVYGDSGF
jgi:hypothetical protein